MNKLINTALAISSFVIQPSLKAGDSEKASAVLESPETVHKKTLKVAMGLKLHEEVDASENDVRPHAPLDHTSISGFVSFCYICTENAKVFDNPKLVTGFPQKDAVTTLSISLLKGTPIDLGNPFNSFPNLQELQLTTHHEDTFAPPTSGSTPAAPLGFLPFTQEMLTFPIGKISVRAHESTLEKESVLSFLRQMESSTLRSIQISPNSFSPFLFADSDQEEVKSCCAQMKSLEQVCNLTL